MMPSRKPLQNGGMDGHHQVARLPTQNDRSSVGMRIKFYETKDNDSDQKPVFQGRTQLKRPENFLTTLHPNQRPTSFASVAKEPIYATVNKIRGQPTQSSGRVAENRSRKEFLLQDSHVLSKTLPEDASKRRHGITRVNGEVNTSKEHSVWNGSYFTVMGKPTTYESDYQVIGPALEEDTVPQTSNTFENKDEIAFLSAEEIGKIYQNRTKSFTKNDHHSPKDVNAKENVVQFSTMEKSERRLNSGCGPLETYENPKEYHQKIIESKYALRQLKKSLSNEDSFQYLDRMAAKNDEMKTPKIRIFHRDNNEHSKTNGNLVEHKKNMNSSKRTNSHENENKKPSTANFDHTQHSTTNDNLHASRKPKTANNANSTSTSKNKTAYPKTNGNVSNRRKNDTTTSKTINFHAGEFQIPEIDGVLVQHRKEVNNANGNKAPNSQTQNTSVEHKTAGKQDSNTSDSTSLTISKKLLTLQENGKSPKLSPKRSKKMYSKRFSLKKTLQFDDHDTETHKELNHKTKTAAEEYRDAERKRHTISAVEYTLADVSPVSVRSNRSLTLPHATLKKSKSESPQSISTSNTQTHITTALLTPDGNRSQESRERSPSSVRTHTSSSHSSLMQGESQLIFKMDLDELYSGDNEAEEKEATTQKEDSNFWPRKVEQQNKKAPKKDKNLNKWIQTDGPPIRAPVSRAFGVQTGINPCTCVSKRLQMRPWNLPDYLVSSVTQTPLKVTTDIGTQTRQKRLRSRGCQTRVKTFHNSDSQTPTPPTRREISVQAVTSTTSTEVQTPDEDSDIWGIGGGVSLDRLIRNGAIKRSKSIGHGIITNEESGEKIRDRSASIGTISDVGTSTTSQGPVVGTRTTGKITTYSWNENGKFVKIFVSYSGIHLIPSKNIQVKTNGINLHLIVEEPVPNNDTVPTATSVSKEGKIRHTLTSTLYLNRLRRPVACLSYNVQRDMITIMLRKQKQTPWNSLIFNGQIV